MTNIFTYVQVLRFKQSVETLIKICEGLKNGEVELCEDGLIMSQTYYDKVFKQLQEI